MAANQEITHFAVQGFKEPEGQWLVINDRIKVAEFMKSGGTKEQAVAKALQEAEKQAAGWGAAYPLRRFRAVPVRGHSW